MTSSDSVAELHQIFISFGIALYWLILNFDTKDIFKNTVNGSVEVCGDALKENLHFLCSIILLRTYKRALPPAPQFSDEDELSSLN